MGKNTGPRNENENHQCKNGKEYKITVFNLNIFLGLKDRQQNALVFLSWRLSTPTDFGLEKVHFPLERRQFLVQVGQS